MENPTGFHTLMYIISQYRQTGKIPIPYEMRTGTTSSLENLLSILQLLRLLRKLLKQR